MKYENIFDQLVDHIHRYKLYNGCTPRRIYVGTSQWHNMKQEVDQYRMTYRDTPDGINRFDGIAVYIVMEDDHLVLS